MAHTHTCLISHPEEFAPQLCVEVLTGVVQGIVFQQVTCVFIAKVLLMLFEAHREREGLETVLIEPLGGEGIGSPAYIIYIRGYGIIGITVATAHIRAHSVGGQRLCVWQVKIEVKVELGRARAVFALGGHGIGGKGLNHLLLRMKGGGVAETLRKCGEKEVLFIFGKAVLGRKPIADERVLVGEGAVDDRCRRAICQCVIGRAVETGASEIRPTEIIIERKLALASVHTEIHCRCYGDD